MVYSPHRVSSAGGVAITKTVAVAVRACATARRHKDWGRVMTWAERGLTPTDLCPEAEGRLRFELAGALMQIGDLLRAEQELVRFCRLEQGCPALSSWLGEALQVRAHIQRLRGQEGQSGRLFQRACIAFAAVGQHGKAMRCRFEIAWGQLMMGQCEGVQQHLAAVRASRVATSDPDLEVDLTIAMALRAKLLGNLSESDRIGWAVLERPALRDRQRAEVAWVLACNALTSGDHQRAGDLLEIAHLAAVTDWSLPQMGRIHHLRLRLHA